MKKCWWRKLAQRFAYPKEWPRVFAYWVPRADEKLPPRIGVSIGGNTAWYSLERPAALRSAA